MKLDPYAELGVGKEATDAEIKAAFRKRVKETHPDKDGGSKDKFERVKAANLVLIDPERRKKYDETGDAGADSVKSVHQRAMELIGALIGAAIEGDKDLEHMDVLADIGRFLADQIKDYDRQQKQLKARRKRAEKFAKKIKRKAAGGENLISRMADNHARAFLKTINTVGEIIDVHKRAAEILSGYSYDFEPPAPQGWPTPPMMSTEGIAMGGMHAVYGKRFGMKGTR